MRQCPCKRRWGHRHPEHRRRRELPAKENDLGKSQSAGTQILDSSPQAEGELTAGFSGFISFILADVSTTARKPMQSPWEQSTQPDQRGGGAVSEPMRGKGKGVLRITQRTGAKHWTGNDPKASGVMREGPHQTLQGLTEVGGCGHTLGMCFFSRFTSNRVSYALTPPEHPPPAASLRRPRKEQLTVETYP